MSRITSCNLVDKQLLSNAYHFIYNSPSEIYRDADQVSFCVSVFRRPMGSVSLKWEGFDNVPVSRDYPSATSCCVSGSLSAVPFDKYIVKAAPLKNEIYYFRLTRFSFANGSNLSNLLLTISDASEHCLTSTPVATDSLITLYVYESYAFIKLVDTCSNTVTSTFSVTGNNPFSVRICRPAGRFTKATFSFNIN